MLTEKELTELNALKCSIHDSSPMAKLDGESIDHKAYWEDFTLEIEGFVKDKALTKLQGVTRDKFGV